jgi:hypothetical protein
MDASQYLKQQKLLFHSGGPDRGLVYDLANAICGDGETDHFDDLLMLRHNPRFCWINNSNI